MLAYRRILEDSNENHLEREKAVECSKSFFEKMMETSQLKVYGKSEYVDSAHVPVQDEGRGTHALAFLLRAASETNKHIDGRVLESSTKSRRCLTISN